MYKPNNPDHPLHAKPFLAPGADFLNHQPSVQVEWRLRSGKGHSSTLHIATQQSYPRAGLEVFNQYAVSQTLNKHNSNHCVSLQDLSNAELFSTFGFTVAQNPYDRIPIHLETEPAIHPKRALAPLHAGMNSYQLAQATSAIKNALLHSFRDLLKPGEEALTHEGISAPLMNTARILSLQQKDLSATGMANIVALNQENLVHSPPYSIQRLGAGGMASLQSAGFVARFTTSLASFFSGRSKDAAALQHIDNIPSKLQALARDPSIHLNVPPRVELEACQLLHTALKQLHSQLVSETSARAVEVALDIVSDSTWQAQVSMTPDGTVDSTANWLDNHLSAVHIVEQFLQDQLSAPSTNRDMLQTGHALRLRLGEEAMLVQNIRRLEQLLRSGMLQQAQTSFNPHDATEIPGDIDTDILTPRG